MFHIYKVENLVNRKIYIGKTTVGVEERFKAHIKDSKISNPPLLLHRALKKYGIENFSVESIATTIDEDELNFLEKKFIKFFDCCVLDGIDRGYNMTRGGDGFDSDTVRKNNIKRVKNGSHPWAGERGSVLNRNTQLTKIREGRHHFAGELGSAFMREEIKRRTENGTNAWAGEKGSAHSKRIAKKCLDEGRHHSQQKLVCPHCNKEGSGNSMKKWHFDRCRIKDGETSLPI